MNRTALTLLPAAAAVLVLGAASPAAADIADIADPHASCVGLALSDHAVSDGPGFISQQMAGLRGSVADFGYRNPGQVVSRWAAVHAGSHEPGCETAIMGILITGP